MGSIYMPVTTPRQKIEAVSMFGKDYVDIVLTGDTFDEANEAAIKYAQRSGKSPELLFILQKGREISCLPLGG